METKYWVWLFAFLYWAYCIFWGIKGYFWANTSGRWAIADRSLPMILFLLAATATSFSGWTYIGHPGLIAYDGLAYAFASFYVITIPITATYFAKRLWLVGKRYNFITPGDLYSYYYGNERGWGEFIRIVILVIAFLFSAFYTAVQLIAAGAIFHVTTGVPLIWGSILLATIVFFYVAAGGIRSVAWVDALQALLLFAGIVAIGGFVLHYFGGWQSFIGRINQLDEHFLTVPGAWNPAVGQEWTGMFQLTYMLSLMGIMASPAFHMWAFANRNPRPFPWQQTFASAVFIGFALFFFTAIQGLGGRALKEDGVIDFSRDADVVPAIILTLLPGWAAGLVVVGALAAMQSTGAAYMGTGGAMLMRDLYVRYINPEAGHREQVWVARLLVFVITALAMAVALTSREAMVMLGGLAVAFGFLMYLPLVNTFYLKWFTRQGIGLGLVAGIIAVAVTFAFEPLQYPLNIHSAGWGGIAAFVTATVVTLFTRKEEALQTEMLAVRQEMNAWLGDIDRPNPVERKWRKAAFVVVPLWFIFAIGPGMVVGNHFVSFGGLPPVWTWQIVWWLLGVVMMWMLCFKANLSRARPEQTERAFRELRPVIVEVGWRKALLERDKLARMERAEAARRESEEAARLEGAESTGEETEKVVVSVSEQPSPESGGSGPPKPDAESQRPKKLGLERADRWLVGSVVLILLWLWVLNTFL